MISTAERARGRWREILPALGVAPRFLVNRHGPCPVCGGKDRFRFDDKNGEGTYFCNQCGAGTGIILVRKLNNWSHKEACDAVDGIIGTDYRPAAHRAVSREPDAAAKIRATERLIAETDAPEVVTAYLRSRGLSVTSEMLLGHPACEYFVEDTDARTGKKTYRLIGRYPAVVAPILSADGRLVSAQRIWRQADVGDDRKKPMPVPFKGALNGAAVRLFDVEDEMGVAEGVENGLASWQLFGVPTWAALTANGLRTFEPPVGIVKLTIFGDNDASFTGQAATFDLAHKLRRTRPEIEVIVAIPPDIDTDWLDVLNAKVLI